MIKKIKFLVASCLIVGLIAYFSFKPESENVSFSTQVYTVGLTTGKTKEKLGDPHAIFQGACTLSRGSSDKKITGEHWIYKFGTKSKSLDINLCIYEGLVFSQQVIITVRDDGIVSTITLDWVSSVLLDDVEKKKPFVFDLSL